LATPDPFDPQRGRLDLGNPALIVALTFWRTVVLAQTKTMLTAAAVPASEVL
jgi:hypothetical protein